MNLPAKSVALDTRGLDDLKRAARESPEKSLRTAATQFEALFMNMILKNMRDAAPKDGLLSSSAGATYTGMLDQQLSQQLAGRGTGLADMLVRQLGKNMKPAAIPGTGAAAGADYRPSAARTAGAASSAATPGAGVYPRAGSPPLPLRPAPSLTPAVPAAGAGAQAPAADPPARKRDFVARMALHAREAEHKTGVPASFMIGQAALESGWGKHEIKDANGQPAFNLFGVKASGKWSGPTVEVTTTEFVGGVAQKIVAKFRAYASYAEGFADYARMMANNPRYANVLKIASRGVESFAQGLQKAGYATDPAYAAKLTKVINAAAQIDRQA
jgi:flagellar protein FlgJ